jgi:hypothetical protein
MKMINSSNLLRKSQLKALDRPVLVVQQLTTIYAQKS